MPKQWPTGVTQIVPRELLSRLTVWRQALLFRTDQASSNQRRAIAVTISLLLHIGVLLLLLPPQKHFLSIGTTGLGEVSGAGTAVTLVEATEIEPPQVKPSQTQKPSEEPSDFADSQVEPEASEQVAPNEPPTPPSDSHAPSDSTAPASAGAFGQNGEAYTDLWNAIAPCWNRIADVKTLPAKLTISFSPDGGLSAPPVIERDPDAEITDDSLHAEAKALQALSECGAYPMAKSLQSVTVKFPPPWQLPQTAAKSTKDSMANRH